MAVIVQRFWHGAGRDIGRATVRRNNHLDRAQLAEDAIADQLAGQAETGVAPLLRGYLQDDVIVADRLDEFPAIHDRIGRRLLDVDVLARLGSSHRDQCVRMVGHADCDNVNASTAKIVLLGASAAKTDDGTTHGTVTAAADCKTRRRLIFLGMTFPFSSFSALIDPDVKKERTPLGFPRGVRCKAQVLDEALSPPSHPHRYLNIEPSETLLV